MAFIATMSPVAWRHVNLFGAMDIGAATMPVDIDALASYYADQEYWAACPRQQPKRATRKSEIPLTRRPVRHSLDSGSLARQELG